MSRNNRMTLGALAALGVAPISIEYVHADGTPVPVPQSIQRFVRGPQRLYLPEAGHQLVAADLDRDGDEDKTQLQIMPLTDYAGKTAAAAGGSADFSIEPVRPCVLLSMKFVVVLASGSADNILLTTFEAGDVNLLPYKGAAPISTYFKSDSTDSNIESPLFGKAVPLSFTLRNNHASNAATIYGAAKVAAIIG